MSQVLVTESYLDDIADAIRDKNGSEDTYTPAQMADAIENIQTADEVVLVSKSISANGTYNPASDSADGYSGVTVNVPNTYTVSDEGKVVSSGALVAQESQNVSQNGTYDTTLKNQVVVAVPNSYSASDEGKVVSSGELVAQTSRNITGNGTYNTTENNEVIVNVPSSGGGRLYLVDPDALDAYANANYKEGGLPISCVMARYSSAPLYTISTNTFDGSTKNCLYRNYSDVCGLIFTSKIPANKYSKMYIKAIVSKSNNSAQRSLIALSSDCNFANGDGWLSGTSIALTDSDMTAEQINNQSGVTISVSDNKILPVQTVEIDLPSTDFYVGMLNWFCTIYIRELYLE